MKSDGLYRWLGVAIVSVLILALFVYKGKIVTGWAEKLLQVKETRTSKVDKNDPNWLKEYCRKEIKNLPQAPFKIKRLDGDVHFLSIPNVYLNARIPSDKRNGTVTCSLWYNYDPKEAYASVAVEYLTDIKSVNTFEENVDRLLSQAIDKSWKKISPLNDTEGGRPAYGYSGVPLVYTRENESLETVEYATADWGANTFYVNLTAYEK
jgi:hypothetical protein